MYGTQTNVQVFRLKFWFENDVKMYGTQTVSHIDDSEVRFENDVKMYGTQTAPSTMLKARRLRMM